MSMFLQPSLGIHDPELCWQRMQCFTAGALGIVWSSWNDFSRHWVHVAGSLGSLTNSHTFIFTCHCGLLWVFLGNRADILVTLAAENDWKGFMLCICVACSLCSIGSCHHGEGLHCQKMGLSLGLLGNQRHVAGTAPLSLPAACQKPLTDVNSYAVVL